MRELRAVISESDVASLVLADVNNGEEFFLPVSDELRALLSSTDPGSSGSVFPIQAVPSDDAASNAGSTGTAGNTNPAATTDSDADATADSTEVTDDSAEATTATASSEEAQSSGKQATHAEEQKPEQAATAPKESADEPVANGFAKRTPGSRPRRASISLSPREIQDRIRHGASVAELAEEVDTDESRIEPYAWPILQERANIADRAHTARPVGADGVQQLTLWEALATSLAAHGVSLSDASWDAYQDASRRWVVAVSWNKQAAGQTATHTAEFLIERTDSDAQLAHPLNSIAGDLTDPRYGQPVRTISPLGPAGGMTPGTGLHDQAPLTAEQRPPDQHTGTQVTSITERFGNRDGHAHDEQQNDAGTSDHASASVAEDASVATDTGEGHATTEPTERVDPQADFLLNPTAESPNHPGSREARNRRKRKAVTPHWEDVLLGVRTNPKKKR